MGEQEKASVNTCFQGRLKGQYRQSQTCRLPFHHWEDGGDLVESYQGAGTLAFWEEAEGLNYRPPDIPSNLSDCESLSRRTQNYSSEVPRGKSLECLKVRLLSEYQYIWFWSVPWLRNKQTRLFLILNASGSKDQTERNVLNNQISYYAIHNLLELIQMPALGSLTASLLPWTQPSGSPWPSQGPHHCHSQLGC